MRAELDRTATPEYYAVESLAGDFTGANTVRRQITLYPTPSDAYTLRMQVDLLQTIELASGEYPICPVSMTGALKACVMAAADEMIGKTPNGDYEQAAVKMLAGAVLRDRGTKNIDHGEMRPDGALRVFHRDVGGVASVGGTAIS